MEKFMSVLSVGLAFTLMATLTGCAGPTPTKEVVPSPAPTKEVIPSPTPTKEVVAPSTKEAQVTPLATETKAPAEVIELVYMRQAEGHQVELDLPD
ncbi:MAG: hypothetical protein ACP5R2_10785 [Anaerolineae bacterium]